MSVKLLTAEEAKKVALEVKAKKREDAITQNDLVFLSSKIEGAAKLGKTELVLSRCIGYKTMEALSSLGYTVNTVQQSSSTSAWEDKGTFFEKTTISWE